MGLYSVRCVTCGAILRVQLIKEEGGGLEQASLDDFPPDVVKMFEAEAYCEEHDPNREEIQRILDIRSKNKEGLDGEGLQG
jgi:hypothetical protein